MSRFDEATFGIWFAEDGAVFEFQRWLKAAEAPSSMTLGEAAQVYLDNGGPRGNQLRPGRYLIQVLNRGQSGTALQAATFDAVPQIPTLHAVIAS